MRGPLRMLVPALALASALLLSPAVGVGLARADDVVPPRVPVAADAAPAIVGETALSDRLVLLQVASPAMRRVVPVKVLKAADGSRPRGAYYLLDGNSGRVDDTNWLDPADGDAQAFFTDKNVNVVFPIGGTGTMYTDWQQDHPKFGRVKWETFLTEELPPLIDARFHTDGRNAIGGISMGAEAAVMLAERHPGLYRAVAGYSGCYQTMGAAGELLTDLVVINGNASGAQMWGPPGGPDWRAHDIFAGAAKLRGTAVYLSSGSGLPGPHETLQTPNLLQVVTTGGVLEFGSNACTDQLTGALRSAGVDVTRSATPVGVHAWAYWRDELARSWPTLQRALG
ncbi:alpha/beta hydrolase [Speluncibacter jeojiensis]|uniref:alpha/beta hydrolase n=1 Tax=Speluncibacter jeojiensis TaxID=2710754 RepID=UPI00240EC0E5|nr:alpha/beta hydrolase family protein [Rhodococcus sp. D2-41]